MTQDFSNLSIEQLQKLLAEADTNLAESLLNGSSWEELRETSLMVTRIAREIHHRKYPVKQTPADTPFRLDY